MWISFQLSFSFPHYLFFLDKLSVTLAMALALNLLMTVIDAFPRYLPICIQTTPHNSLTRLSISFFWLLITKVSSFAYLISSSFKTVLTWVWTFAGLPCFHCLEGSCFSCEIFQKSRHQKLMLKRITCKRLLA